MKRNPMIYSALVLSLVLAGLNLLALNLHLYWTVWWYDVLMHFLAGVVGGLATYGVLFDTGFFYRPGTPSRFARALIVFTCVMFVGLAWEWMEIAFDLTNSHEGYPIDPIFDLILDGSGALLAAYFGLRQRRDSAKRTING